MNATFDLDTSALVKALDRIPDAILVKTRAASRISAEHIQREIRAWLERMTHGTGQTADHITVEDSHSGHGAVIFANAKRSDGRGTRLHVPRWLEYGTTRLAARPFFFLFVHMEEAAHAQRIRTAMAE